MNQFLEVIHRLQALGINPLAAVIVAALLCALVEQRWRRRRTPDFSGASRDIYGRPQKPS